ncbi:MAG: YkgJ family cysteine cluster protein [Deltaproteobacteria bacterium]|nr:MAG: YkgJ family cysteine cluster protein [Deltaproteobacteria bacterium]
MDSKYKTAEDIFECQLCGDCCKGFGGTYVTDRDILKIASFINADPATFVETYCDYSGSRPVLTLGTNGACVFFDTEKQCTIHPVKPYMCRAWPYIKTIIKNPENWNVMASACPGIKKDIPHDTLQQIVTLESQRLDQSISLNGSPKKEIQTPGI